MAAVWRAHLGLGVAGIAGYVVAPADVQSLLYLTISISVPAAIVVGVRRNRPAVRAPWIVMAAAFALYVLGDSIYTMYEYVGTGDVPYPNVGDLAYLVFYPLVYFALGRFVGAAHRDPTAWLDSSVWTIGAALLAWKPLIEPYFTEAPTLGGVVGLAYPLLDLGLVLMVVRLIAGGSARTPAYWLLMAGLTSQLVSDVFYSLQILQTDSTSGVLLDIGWLSTYVVVGAAALHPSMLALTTPGTKASVAAGRLRLGSLLIPTLSAPALLLYVLIVEDAGVEKADGLVIVAGATVLILLVVARAGGLLSILERRSKQLIDRQTRLESVLLERERATESLHRRVNRDALTGLASRDLFVSALQAALSAGSAPSVAFIDLDDFKTVNDTMGHEVGDLLLVDLARRLQTTVSAEDLVARFGGDEFAVLVMGDVELVVNELLTALQPPLMLEGREIRLQVSIGVTTATAEPTSASEMLRRADIAMYTAKRAGGGWARYLTGMSAMLRHRVDLRARLVDALRGSEIQPWFQPVVDVETGELRGFEALARWVSAEDGMLPPDQWLPMAEETGLVMAVDRAVARAAVAQLAVWRTHHDVDDLYLSINMSARTLQQRGVAEDLLGILDEHAVPANRIVVEVTEGVLIDDEQVSARLQILRGAGIRVALDDFGTGWSSLSYLQRFPVDQLKLDCSFTAELASGIDGEAIPAAVLQLARALALEVVAEGVETLEQAERLVELGFQRAQGYLFGAAEPADHLEALLGGERPQFMPAVLSRRLAGLGASRRGRTRSLRGAG